MLSALLPTPGFAQNWTLPVSKLKHVCSLVFVRFRLQTSASNSEQIDVGQMSQKIHAPVAMDLQQNRSTDRNCPFSFQPYFAPTSQITFSTKYLKRIPTLCFANKLANFCRCLMFFLQGLQYGQIIFKYVSRKCLFQRTSRWSCCSSGSNSMRAHFHVDVPCSAMKGLVTFIPILNSSRNLLQSSPLKSFSLHSGVVSLLSGVMSAAGQLQAVMFWILHSYCLKS